MTTLPPPPGSPLWGPEAPISPVPTAQLPRWRQGKAGWILLHLVIGVGLWFGLVFVAGIAVAAAGRIFVEDSVSDVGALDVWTLLLLLGSVAGWILFVYLRAALWIRWLVLVAAAGIPAIALILILLDALPQA